MNFMIDFTETREIRRVTSLNSEKVSLKYSIFICLFKSMFIFSSPALTSLIVYLVFSSIIDSSSALFRYTNKQSINQSKTYLTSKRKISR